MKFYNVSWIELHALMSQLAGKVIDSGEKFDLIVAMARGGLTMAHIMTDLLNLPITSFTISSYKDLKQQETPVITFEIGGKLHDKKILLIDDVSDTGKTFVRGIEYLKELGANKVMTAAPFVKPWAKFVPDYSIKKVEDWIIFPYEMRETVEALSKKFSSEGMGKESIMKKLQDIGIPKRFISSYLR